MKGHALSLLLVIGVQRKRYIKNAELIARIPEHETHRELANVNCFVTGTGAEKNALVH